MTAAARTVVVVDDDAVSRLVLARMVRRLGHRVHEAASLTQAVAVVGAEQPDLVLSDYCLPDGTGAELHDALRATGRAPRFVLVTGVAAYAGRGGGSAEQEALTTLTKPVDSRSLAACLERVLAAAGW